MLLIKIENVGEELDRVRGAKKIVSFFLNTVSLRSLWDIQRS